MQGEASLDRRAGDRRLLAAAFVLVAVPFVVAIASAIGAHWHPAGDEALAVLRIRDVGGAHTPLLGAWSRWGWSHPGPALFWLLAPFERVLGNDGVLIGAALTAGVAAVGTVFVARIVGGTRFAVFTAVGVVVLVHGLGATTIFDPWNPWVAVVPFLLTVMCVAGAVAGHPRLLIAAVAVGSFVVQAHVGYVGLVGVLVSIAFVTVAVRSWRVAGVAAAVGLVMWLPAVVEQLRGHPGNLGLLVKYIRSSPEPTAGWSVALRTLGAHLRPIGPWITNDEYLRSGFERTTSPVGGLLVVLALAVLGVAAWKRGRATPARVALVVLVTVGLGVMTSARITGPYVPYVVAFWRVIAMLVWVTIVWLAAELLAPTDPAGQAMPRLVPSIVALAVGLAVVTLVVARAPTPVPLVAISDDIAHVGPSALAATPRRGVVLVTGHDIALLDASMAGLFTYLEPHRSNVRVPTGPYRASQYGKWRLVDPARADFELSMFTTPAVDPDWTPPAGARVVASWDRLTPAERHRARELQRRIARAVAARPHESLPVDTERVRDQAVARGARRRDVEALARLQGRGDLVVVTLSDLHAHGV